MKLDFLGILIWMKKPDCSTASVHVGSKQNWIKSHYTVGLGITGRWRSMDPRAALPDVSKVAEFIYYD